MVTIRPRWRFPVEDREGQRSQLAMDPTGDGRLTFTPPDGPYSISVDELPAFIAQLEAHWRLLSNAVSNAETARQLAR